ncbi:MAG: 2-oxo acid dehydrogenase subunit E2 [Betaproteobacteria bacterium]|nr:2-oxo acid dehydrogenase subunit E2 [Betaproteobacteria bacterium]MDE2622679.1 2-oxo acid dehydrogenase subunit E2 [Betaproteobacteria bacterium]
MIDFTLPALGADMTQGKLLEWKVKPGDAVTRGQVVAVVDTSKAAVDVEIWQEGTVAQLLVRPGETVPVGTPMARLLVPGELPASRRRVSPAAKQRATALGIVVDEVSGTGPEGAVTLEDVERTAASAVPPVARAASPTGKVADMRAVIGAAMSRSKREIPHYYLGESIPMARAQAWLESFNAGRPLPERLLMALLPIKAVALALQKFPEFNGFYRNGTFEAGTGIHVGVAIALRQGGLVAPALHDVADKPLPTLMQELSDLVLRARNATLRSSELSDATVTVTNLGDQGVESVFGVIYPPQVALVGLGRVSLQPWVEGESVQALPVMRATLSADHRVSDGHRGGLLLSEVRERLQHPETL